MTWVIRPFDRSDKQITIQNTTTGLRVFVEYDDVDLSEAERTAERLAVLLNGLTT